MENRRSEIGLVRSAEIRARGCPSGAEITAFIGSVEYFDLTALNHVPFLTDPYSVVGAGE
jgi:hypothetical protein